MSSSRSARSWLVSAFHQQYWLALFCSTSRVALLSLLTCRCLNLSCFVLLNTSSRSARCRLVSVSIFLALFHTSSRPARCWLVSTVSLTCLRTSVSTVLALLLLNTSSYSAHSRLVSVLLSQYFLLCFAQHLDSLCSLLSCLWQLSQYPYIEFEFEFFVPVLVSFSPSAHVSFTRALSVSTFLSSLSIRFLSCCFL